MVLSIQHGNMMHYGTKRAHCVSCCSGTPARRKLKHRAQWSCTAGWATRTYVACRCEGAVSVVIGAVRKSRGFTGDGQGAWTQLCGFWQALIMVVVVGGGYCGGGLRYTLWPGLHTANGGWTLHVLPWRWTRTRGHAGTLVSTLDCCGVAASVYGGVATRQVNGAVGNNQVSKG